MLRSNAKSIRALSDAVARDRQERLQDREGWRQVRDEWRQDRSRVFEWMARLATAQADHLTHLERIDDRKC